MIHNASIDLCFTLRTVNSDADIGFQQPPMPLNIYIYYNLQIYSTPPFLPPPPKPEKHCNMTLFLTTHLTTHHSHSFPSYSSSTDDPNTNTMHPKEVTASTVSIKRLLFQLFNHDFLSYTDCSLNAALSSTCLAGDTNKIFQRGTREAIRAHVNQAGSLSAEEV